MPLSADISTALHLLEHMHDRMEDCDDPKLQMHTTQDLKSLISLLEDPVFRSIVSIQDSLMELNGQLGQHPSILPGDFDINISGKLELSLPSTPVQPLGPNIYQDLYQDSSELEDQRVPVAPLVHSSSEDTSAQVTSPSLASEVMGIPPITTPTYAKEFKKVIEAAAKGRQIYNVQLYKPDGTSLGFSVVGLRSKDRGELGIFLQEIQPNGIAGCDGRLVEGDQILAIDGQPLDSNISHEQAISILQKARGLVELVVARSAQDVGSSLPTDELSGGSIAAPAAGGATASVVAGIAGHNQISDQSVSASSVVTPILAAKSSQLSSTATAATTPTVTPTPTTTPTPTPLPAGLAVERSPSAVSDASKSGSDMVLNTEWAQVEVINLINDGSGLGFGIIGGRSTGVVVKTILPGGVADRDNRLQSGDHILQIGDVNLRGMGSEQVAAVLRQSGTHVRLVVARPVEPTSPDYQALGSHAPIVPTKILGDPDELDRHLVHSVSESYPRPSQDEVGYDNGYMYTQESDIEMHARSSLIMDVVRNPMPVGTMPIIPAVSVPMQLPELPVLTMEPIDINSLPEMERFTVELKKDIYGLGITIAGYVCEKEELSGIFVKSISEGSAADLSNKIQINDRIVEVDGHSLQGYSNHEAVEVLRSTGQTVTLCLERYLRGPKYEQLQQAIAASELRLPQPSSPSITSLPSFPISADGETTTEIEPEGESHTTVDSAILQEVERDKGIDNLDEAANVEALLSDPSSELTPQIRAAIKSKWQKIVGPDTEIVVAQLKKFAEGSGLGISLEGTVDVENGQEVRPHHYIRSILPEGPVGQNGTLRSGDELLEVNGYRLLGINHMEVVSVLKELPIHVRMVCGRNIASQDPLCPIDTAQHQAAFQTRSILGGSLQNLLPTMDRLVKAKSDGSLASTTTTATVTDASLNKMKSRSLEPLTGLAMWSSEPQIIELVKGERGLGFSILDYQDPMNPNETVIVIRSLVPGGVAQVDGQLIPGDRLLFVNDIALENATLDQAVQALKGAPKGTVRIGVAKPLPIPDSIVQRVASIRKVKRSRSLPNDSETTDRANDLEDFLSSRSGVTDLSMDKATPTVTGTHEEDDEDEDQWKDASPITPVCSPTRVIVPRPDHIPDIPEKEATILDVPPRAKLKKTTSFDERDERDRRRRRLKRYGSLDVDDRGIDKSEHSSREEEVKMSKSRRKSLREQECIDRVTEFLRRHSVVLPCPESPAPVIDRSRVDPVRDVEQPVTEERLTEPPVTEPPVTLKRPTSLLKRKDSPQDDARKEVRIHERVEEIFFEDLTEHSSNLPEIQLVKARIITPEEAVTCVLETARTTQVEVYSPVVVSVTREPAASTLQLPGLAKSTSDNALIEVELSACEEDRKVSQRNLKPEILLDLSKMVVDSDEASDRLPQEKQPSLSRAGSEGSRRVQGRPKVTERVDSSYELGRLAQREEPEVTVISESSTSEEPRKQDDTSTATRLEEEVSLLEEVSRRLEEERGYGLERREFVGRHPLKRQEEDISISKEHSLEYQSQTLESQSDRFAVSFSSLEDLLGPSEVSEVDEEVEDVEDSEEDLEVPQSVSPISRERREVETQTQQENKSTQCSPEQSSVSPSEDSSKRGPFHACESHYQSPRREVQTQTQGEHKLVQCSLDNLGDLRAASYSYEEQESKSVQCPPSSLKSTLKSPRREVEVQTYQECKAVQCSDEELLEADYSASSDRSEDSLTPRRVTTVVFVEDGRDMTVTHRDRDGNVSWTQHWGPERLVEIYREPKTSLGLSIVGGKVDLRNGDSSQTQNISGIFIKNVQPNSPAGRTGDLKVGDRIIEVDGVDLRHSSHERAVQVIQASGNPVCLRVQSLVHLSSENDEGGGFRQGGGVSGAKPSSSGSPTSSRRDTSAVSPARPGTPEVIQGGIDGEKSISRSDFKRQSTKGSDGAGPSTRRSSMKKSIRKKAPSPPPNPGILREVSEERDDGAKAKTSQKAKYSSEESSDEEDTRELEGNVYTKGGMEISRKSAGNVKRSKAEIEADPEQEDEYGYTQKKIHKKYHNLGEKNVRLVKIERDRFGLGLSLAGHKDRNRMAVYVCGLNPNGAAHKTGSVAVGDEILEVNGAVLQGRCHLNASAIIKGMATTVFRVVTYRKSGGINDCAVKPITQFPPTLDDVDFYSMFKGVRDIPVKKGQYGLGIMIIEGKHAEVGQGIFISDIQEGSAAEQAGLNVGDMILAVNKDCLLGSTYDQATSLLKKAEGVVTLSVCNPNQSKVGTEEEEKSREAAKEKQPDKPKEPEPPANPKDCKIKIGSNTTIEFQKEKDRGIGFSIAGGSDTPMNGVYVLDVFTDGAAAKDGRLRHGDQIIDMCGQSFKSIEHDKAHASILKVSGTITMVVYRKEKPDEEFDVELQKKAGKGAGLCLTGFNSGRGAYVSDLLPGGSALECGKICKGDRVVSICGQDMRDAPVEDIAFNVKVSNPVQLKLARYIAKQ